jgi:hypothetical protein
MFNESRSQATRIRQYTLHVLGKLAHVAGGGNFSRSEPKIAAVWLWRHFDQASNFPTVILRAWPVPAAVTDLPSESPVT